MSLSIFFIFINITTNKTKILAKLVLKQLHSNQHINAIVDDVTTSSTGDASHIIRCGRQHYILYEVKFTNSKIDNHVVNEEISQALKANLNPINYGFISKNGFNITNDNNYILITLDDIYDIK